MAPLDTLTEDQRAVLQMLLRRDNSYEDLALLLKTDIGVVRKRARAAIAAIGPDASEIGSERRDELADYLLGQQTVARHEATREYLRGSSPGRAWATDVATTLSPLAGGTLPDIPGDGADTPTADAAPSAAPSAAPTAAPAAAPEAPKRNPQLGSRLIAAGIGLVLAIAIIVVISLGGDDDDPTANDTPTQTSTTTRTTPSGDQYNVVAAASLLPPKGVQSTAKGDVAIFQFPATGQYRLGLQARGLPPSSTRGSAYGVWLYTSAVQEAVPRLLAGQRRQGRQARDGQRPVAGHAELRRRPADARDRRRAEDAGKDHPRRADGHRRGRAAGGRDVDDTVDDGAVHDDADDHDALTTPSRS